MLGGRAHRSSRRSISRVRVWLARVSGTCILSASAGKGPSMKLTPVQTSKIQTTWRQNPSFLGFPDAERDAANAASWLENLFLRPHWFDPALQVSATLV